MQSCIFYCAWTVFPTETVLALIKMLDMIDCSFLVFFLNSYPRFMDPAGQCIQQYCLLKGQTEREEFEGLKMLLTKPVHISPLGMG